VAGGVIPADGSAFHGKWSGLRPATSDAEVSAFADTGVAVDTLRRVGTASVAIPDGFKPHERLLRTHVQPRLTALKDTSFPKIDWATAEALAFGSLLLEGHHVRLSGQDAQRGTFSQRHAVLIDQATSAAVTPLNHALPAAERPNGASLEVVSSLLSEFAVLGFELGFSWESPKPLVLWEAQFGDFANGAQIIIDQFVAGTETKWLRQSGLVMLLPHGYDGAGPEHSSCRMERFLQLVNSQQWTRRAPGTIAAGSAATGDKTVTEAVNMIVANPTTPAQYFHLLRRQVAKSRPFRKPLIIAAPKTLLRHPEAVSSLEDMAPGTGFLPFIGETDAGVQAQASKVRRVVLCSGKLHLELAARRKEVGATDSAIVRVEELAPFPTEALLQHITATYPGAKEVVWCQEEPANAGAWTFAEAHLTPALLVSKLPALQYIGRPALPAPAVGLAKPNKLQQDTVVAACFPKRS
jgi:probable 2-oxoglutarate dehydrogenase E1 component DHKTD1